MLKIVNRNCAGIDVHKKIIVVTIAKTNEQDITEYQTKSFTTFTEDLVKCREWLVSNNTLDVCMESTGKYWIPIFNILEEKCHCVITHPKYVRTIPGKKTDKKDSIWIADMFKHGLVEPSFMPPVDIRQLRDLMRYRNKLVNVRSSEKNRFQNSLTMSNVQIANVVTDVFGKTSQSILKLMLTNHNLTLDDITPLLRKNLKSSPEDILKSINGNFDESQSSKMNIVLKHYEDISIVIQQTTSFRDEMLDKLMLYRFVEFYPSQANFIYGKAENKELLLKLFKEADITIRDFAGTDHFRISIGNKQENEAVLNVMSQYVREML